MWIWFVLLGSLFNIMIALTVKTENFTSSVIFKFAPIVLGFGGLMYCLIEMDLIG